MRRLAPLLSIVWVAACTADRPDPSASADSALARDIALAGRDGGTSVLGDTALTVGPVTPAPAPVAAERPAPVATVDRPAASPRPAAPTPVAPTTTATPTPAPPTPAPTTPAAATTPPAAATPDATPAAAPGPAPARRALGAGTAIVATTSTRICSRTNRPGDKLVATLSEPLTASDGSTIAAGTPVVFEVAQTTPTGEVTLRLRAISVDGTSVPLEGSSAADGARETARVPGGDDKGKVVRGAIIGAIAGRILGGGARGAVIGAAGGAAVGTAQAMKGGGTEQCLAPGATVRATLVASATLP